MIVLLPQHAQDDQQLDGIQQLVAPIPCCSAEIVG
jgi:hypothetical protein